MLINQNAGLSSMPFLCMWLFTMALSKILTVMQNKNLITVTMSRKIGTLFGKVEMDLKLIKEICIEE